MSNDINLTAVLKADGERYDVLCLDVASNEARLWDESRKRDFYVGLECIELDAGLDLIERIYEWNKERGLLEKGYKKSREASFIAEELSELLRGDELASDIDAYIDSVIFQIGALSKILQSKERVKRCFEAVLNANDAKGKATDASGKIIKNRACFVEPNEVIKAVLNECKK